MLNVAQIIFIFRDRNFIDGTYILMVNNYVEIIGVLLATLWYSGTSWQGSHATSEIGAGRVREREVVLESGQTYGTELKFATPSMLDSRVQDEV